MRRGAPGATNNLYCGLHEYEDMAFLLHYLRPEDTFVDIGANVGSFTMLATGHVGASTICFEPIPDTYSMLKQNIGVNTNAEKVTALNIGLGAKPGSLKFTREKGGMNHVALDTDKDIVEVPVDTLDNIMTGKSTKLIKIDVEGFETEVFNGGEQTLSNKELRAVIIEFGLGFQFGFDEDKLREKFLKHGFISCRYDPRKREIFPNEKGRDNTLYIRDIEFVKERVKKAAMVTVNRNIF